jgi:hypothetical protein
MPVPDAHPARVETQARLPLLVHPQDDPFRAPVQVGPLAPVSCLVSPVACPWVFDPAAGLQASGTAAASAWAAPYRGDVNAWALLLHSMRRSHKSYNPGPWSGFSMHPVESTIYLSSALFPALFLPQHPVHFLFKKFYTSISPIGGHDGFDQPGGGSFIHYLHHAHFNCALPPTAYTHRRNRLTHANTPLRCCLWQATTVPPWCPWTSCSARMRTAPSGRRRRARHSGERGSR